MATYKLSEIRWTPGLKAAVASKRKKALWVIDILKIIDVSGPRSPPKNISENFRENPHVVQFNQQNNMPVNAG